MKSCSCCDCTASQRCSVLARHLNPAAASTYERQLARLAPSASTAPYVVVVGGMVLDVQAAPAEGLNTQRGGSVPGTIIQACGGVARNIAEGLALFCRSWSQPLLLTVIGQDGAGDMLLKQLQVLNLPTSGITRVTGAGTPTVSTVFDSGGEVAASVADVGLVEQHFTPQLLLTFKTQIRAALLLLLDGNLPAATLQAACEVAASSAVPVWFEPVSAPKAVRGARLLSKFTYISPNVEELLALASAARGHGTALSSASGMHLAPFSTADEALSSLRPHLELLLQAGVKFIYLTLGALGAALCCRSPEHRQSSAVSKIGGFGDEHSGSSSMVIAHIAALPARVVNTSGAGDCLVAGAVTALLQGLTPLDALAHGMAAAGLAVESTQNVPHDLSLSKLQSGAMAAIQSLQNL